MTTREYMAIHGGNLSWCKPMSIHTYADDDVTVVVNEGVIVGAQVNGFYTEMSWNELASLVNPCHGLYSGWEAEHIALDVAGWEDGECSACPWNDCCDAMDMDVEYLK